VTIDDLAAKKRKRKKANLNDSSNTGRLGEQLPVGHNNIVYSMVEQFISV